MSERSLRYLEKSDFGGMRSRRGKRKPNQLYVCDTTTKWPDFPRGPHFNKLPVQLILEILKYLSAYELLRNVSLVCKYWYNLCRERTLWTSITWNGTQRTLGHLLQLTKYQVRELVLTDNLRSSSGIALFFLLDKCIHLKHLKYLKLPKHAPREVFKRELSKTNILGGIPDAGYRFSFFDDANILTRLRNYWKLFSKRSVIFNPVLDYAKEIEVALASLEHKRFLTLEEFFGNNRMRECTSRSARIYEKAIKAPRQCCSRNIQFQDFRLDRGQHQHRRIKPRPHKGRSNHHKEVMKFRRLQKRFKVYNLK
ncbi:hypothetical protein CHS0354_029772 [Potamilus streckersoni]|uniref:F-box domain-containing protein n=1 Tax=Potamilus streckersoni TaxID=2493646 RepID=A0AAE0WD47_9BIVA|nr:hypothetical protein CHS0354_029772 [Potamilus streckersoni]